LALVSFADFKRKTSTFCRIAPVFRSTEIARNDLPSSVAVVSQMRSPWITGDDQPFPGMGTFHRTFVVSLQFSGSPCSSDVPCPVGPRNCGQSEAGRINVKRSSRAFIWSYYLAQKVANPTNGRDCIKTRVAVVFLFVLFRGSPVLFPRKQSTKSHEITRTNYSISAVGLSLGFLTQSFAETNESLS